LWFCVYPILNWFSKRFEIVFFALLISYHDEQDLVLLYDP